MSVATRRGDGGETDLLFGRRVGKGHPRVAAGGDVDELSAAIGLARAELAGAGPDAFLAAVQADLVALMGELATLPEDRDRYAASGMAALGDGASEKLDRRVAEVEAGGLTFGGWVFAGAAGSRAGAALDFARAVCRRAERSVVSLADEAPPPAAPYLNRLSDALWLCARELEQA